MIPLSARPALAAKARLRFDRHAGRDMLIYPEKGLILNATGAGIVKLCTGEHSVAEIVEQLAAASPGTPRPQIEGEVLDFLEALSLRGLLRGVE
jgi:coenzyme PQQ biosynthesis protein PqqD